MNNLLVIFFIGFVALLLLFNESHGENLTSKQSNSTSSSSSSSKNLGDWRCEELDFCDDKSGFEAIKWLHHQLDDDANGNVDITESDEFLRDELHYENANDRHRNFHGNDKHISVDELWKSWKVSEVHNWTIDETLDWLSTSLELPQYVDIFLNHKVDGTTLPRLANAQFISALGIKDPIHRQKISLKAMDVVLFGPPKMHNYLKDIILVISCIIAIGGLWHAIITNRYSRKHLKKMLQDMDSLQKAEEQLQELQKELDEAKEEQRIATMEKAHLQEILASEMDNRISNLLPMKEGGSLSNFGDVNQELAEELRITKEQLARAETALANNSWAPPHKLQLWLQLTYELELCHYNAKRQAAESQLQAAREGCEKLKKKRSSFLGSFKVAHGSSIDDVDNRIHLAKTALSDVTKDLKERLYRWQQIEQLCGFPIGTIVDNRGLLHIQTELYSCYPTSPTSNTSEVGPSLTRNNSDNAMQEVDSDSYELPKNPLPPLNRSITLRSGKSLPVDGLSSMVSLSSPQTTASATSLHQRNQIPNGSAQTNGDETHSSGDSNNGEDEVETKPTTRPCFVLGDCPTIPENSRYMELSRGRTGFQMDRKRKESVYCNNHHDISCPPPSLTLSSSNGKVNEFFSKHRTVTSLLNSSNDDDNHPTNLNGESYINKASSPSSASEPSTGLNQGGGGGTDRIGLSNQSNHSSSSNNLEEKGYSSGGETQPFKKKGSSKGIKFFSKLRKRKSLPEREFTTFIRTSSTTD